ncbi:MAG: rRNA maturation RNase YbeY [Elusimicrobiota bacterium]
MGRKKELIVRVRGVRSLPSAARRPRLYAEAVRQAFRALKSDRTGEICVVFVSRARMLEMNRRYLNHDYDTDVITFEHESLPGVPADETALGDIIVSAWMVRRQARELHHAPAHEAAILTAHGALHLLGLDDRHPRSKARMFQIQTRIASLLRA